LEILKQSPFQPIPGQMRRLTCPLNHCLLTDAGSALLAIVFEPRLLLQGCGQLQCAMEKCLNREVIAFENNTVRALSVVECHTLAMEYLL